MTPFRIALIGNPNSGKTTLFNALTGAHQKVGNWPGVTVEKKSGTFNHNETECEIVDLPGIYSLEQDYIGLDEKIARNFLTDHEFDVIINIVDASNLQRNLILTQQLLELGHPTVVAVNMIDVAEQQGVYVDVDGLSNQLDVTVVPIIASRQEGVPDLLREIFSVETGSAIEAIGNGDFVSEKIIRRYSRAEEIVSQAVQMVPIEQTATERLDRWVLNRWLGIPIFLAMMYLMFTVAINFGAVFIDFFDILFGTLVVDFPRWLLESANAPVWLTVLLADGLGGGI
ncbi:MAG: ferrous iron transporter B, partial [Gammaproteobacteria bacterium]|nr:ferrous iron transporter B [Gammaproteobacteria bacterium]